MNELTLTRRQALARMAVAMGAVFIGPRLWSREFLAGGAQAGADFSAEEIAVLDEIADTILPDTDVPGAKAAQTGACIALIVRDCFEPAERRSFAAGLATLLDGYERRFGVAFAAGRPADRLDYLNDYNRLLRGHQTREQRAAETADVRCFRQLKQLTLLGYFTSEIGCTQALRYAEVPGGYDGNAPYRPGDRNWFGELR
jgi:hypothetical protein